MSLLKVGGDLTPMYRHKTPPTLLFKSKCKTLPLICLAFISLFKVLSFQMYGNFWGFFGVKFTPFFFFFFWVCFGGSQVASIHQTKSLMPFDLLMFRSSMRFSSCFKLGKSSR
jgi:hypothetical protein